MLAAIVARAPMGLLYDEIAAHTGWRQTDTQETIRALSSSKAVKTIGDERPLLLAAGIFESMCSAINDKIDRFQRENPLMPGITREDLRSSIGRRVKPADISRRAGPVDRAEKVRGAGRNC